MAMPETYQIGEVYQNPFKNMLVYPTPKWIHLAGGRQQWPGMSTHRFVVYDADARVISQQAQALERGIDFKDADSHFTEIDGPLSCMAIIGKQGKKNHWTTVCATTVPALGEAVAREYGIKIEEFNAAMTNPTEDAGYDIRVIDPDVFATPVKGEAQVKSWYKTWPKGRNTPSRGEFR